MSAQWGATPEEWAHFDLMLGLTEHLLPVVSNTAAPISEQSKIKALGKTPSRYNAQREVVGIADWTQKLTSGAQVAAWAKEPDYGICVMARAVRALDIDVPDAALAERIERSFVAALGTALPVRYREGTGKRLLGFGLAGVFPKRSFKVDGGLVEFLGDGQQFVAAGVHTSGTRYEWRGGLPAEFPEVDAAAFEAAWEEIVREFAIAPAVGGVVRQRGAAIEGVPDPTADWLQDQGLVLGEGRDGSLYVECPWKDGHSSDSGITEAAWFPAGTNGYSSGNFRCLHASCTGHGARDFEAAVGFTADDFSDLSVDPAPGAGNGVGVVDAGEGSEPRRVIDRADLTLMAQAAMRKRWRCGEHATLLRACGQWYEHDGQHYSERVEEDIRSDLWRFLSGVSTYNKKGEIVPLAPTRDYIGNVADALRSVAERRGAIPPSWLGTAGDDPADIIPLADGLLHVPTRTLTPHTPAFFSLNVLPYRWADSTSEPTAWLAFLRGLWGDDQAAIDTLQEWMGYTLTPDTSQQKMLLLVGPKRSGKGTIGRVLTALVGAHNTCAPSMASFAGEFGLEPLIGKLAAIFPDARTGAVKMNSQAVVERLLQLSGEDSMTINRKNKTMWTGQLAARVAILTNEPPRLGDASGALPGRFITLSLYRSFYGQEDLGLTSRLYAELPAIFRWALDGRDRLAARGHFVQPESGLDDAEDMAAMGNPTAQFVETCCLLGEEGEASTDDLYDAWRDWCRDNGHHAGAKETFGRSLRVAFPQIGKSRLWAGGVRQMVYTGITLGEVARKKLQIGGL